MTHDVFISYSTNDRAVADSACTTLEAEGLRCWLAQRDVMPGADWGEAIIDAIGASRVMLLLLSSHSNASPQVRREVERAVSKGVVVIPFRIEDVAPSKALEYHLSSTHWVDALTPPVEQHLRDLAGRVRQFGLTAAATESTATTAVNSGESAQTPRGELHRRLLAAEKHMARLKPAGEALGELWKKIDEDAKRWPDKGFKHSLKLTFGMTKPQSIYRVRATRWVDYVADAKQAVAEFRSALTALTRCVNAAAAAEAAPDDLEDLEEWEDAVTSGLAAMHEWVPHAQSEAGRNLAEMRALMEKVFASLKNEEEREAYAALSKVMLSWWQTLKEFTDLRQEQVELFERYLADVRAKADSLRLSRGR